MKNNSNLDDNYMGTLMIDPNSSFAQGTKLAFEGYWNLISSVYRNTAGNPITRTVSHTSGITESEGTTLTRSSGLSYQFGIPFGSMVRILMLSKKAVSFLIES